MSHDAPTHPARPMIEVIFHADLSHLADDPRAADVRHWVRADDASHPLAPHTDASRAAARAAHPHLADVPDARLTHVSAPVALPADAVLRVHIKHSTEHLPEIHAPAVPGHVAMFVPPADAVEGQSLALMFDPVSTAKALAFHHPDLASTNPDIARIVYGYMNDNREIATQFEHLGKLIREMGPPSTDPSRGWATLVPYTPPPCEATGVKGTPTFFCNATPTYMAAAGAAQTNLMLVSKNDPALQGKKWHVQYGTNTVPAEASGHGAAPARDRGDEPALQPTRPADVDVATLARLETSDAARVSAADAATTNDDDWTVALTHTERTSGLQVSLTDVDADAKRFTIHFSDRDLRYLGMYIRFYDAEGNTIDLSDWTPDGEDSLTSLTYDIRSVLGPLIEYDDLQFIGYTSGTTTVLGVPTVDGTLDVTVTMPEGAVAAEVFGSGIGTSNWQEWKTPLFGGALTAIMDFIVPAFMLVRGAAQYSNATDKAMVRKLLNGKWKLAVAQAIYYLGDAIYDAVSTRQINWADLINVAKVLFQPASLELLLYIEAEMAIEEAEEEIPFAGWILLALNVSVGIAELSETIVEVLTSPWNIQNGITSTITTTVEVFPDPRHQAFPQAPAGDTAALSVTMTYKNQGRPAVASTQTVPASTPASLTALFPHNTLGGQIKIDVAYVIDGWQAGQASSGWLDNDEAHAAEIVLYLVENPVPLDESTTFQHSAILTYDAADGYGWTPSATAPNATRAIASTQSSGNEISSWNGLTLSQRYAALGFAWKAAGTGLTSCSSGAGGQLFAMMNVGIPGGPTDETAFPSCGLENATRLLYDPYPPKFEMQDGNWVLDPTTEQPVPDPSDVSLGDYWVDPRRATVDAAQGGGYCLRAIDLSAEANIAFDMDDDLPCWARFSLRPDAMTIHPSGNVIAVNTASGKLSIAPLQTAAQSDAEVPLAVDFAGAAMDETRAGLLFSPRAVSCAYDGTILVLEQTKGSTSDLATIPAVSRIQAFDLGGNPVNRFLDGDGQPTPFLWLDAGSEITYLDLCAVGDRSLTYLFVLSYQDAGNDASDYQVAIYQYGTKATASNPLVTAPNIAAANLFVDMWHTLYALDYAMVTGPDGTTPAGPSTGVDVGPDGRTVPALSEWLPSIPTDD